VLYERDLASQPTKMSGSWWFSRLFTFLVLALLSSRMVWSKAFDEAWLNVTTRSLTNQDTQPQGSKVSPDSVVSNLAMQSNRLGDLVAAGMEMTRATETASSTTASDELTMLALEDTPSLSITATALIATSTSKTVALGNYSSSYTGD
jgi:hypothetical protein